MCKPSMMQSLCCPCRDTSTSGSFSALCWPCRDNSTSGSFSALCGAWWQQLWPPLSPSLSHASSSTQSLRAHSHASPSSRGGPTGRSMACPRGRMDPLTAMMICQNRTLRLSSMCSSLLSQGLMMLLVLRIVRQCPRICLLSSDSNNQHGDLKIWTLQQCMNAPSVSGNRMEISPFELCKLFTALFRASLKNVQRWYHSMLSIVSV